MRLKSVLSPHSCHHHVADLQMRSEFARAPVGRTTRRCMSCRLQNPCFQFRGEHGGHLPQMPTVESRNALLRKSSLQLATKPRLQTWGQTLHPRYGPRPATKSAAPVEHLPPARPARGSMRQFLQLRILSVMVSVMDTIIVYKCLLQSTRPSPRSRGVAQSIPKLDCSHQQPQHARADEGSLEQARIWCPLEHNKSGESDHRDERQHQEKSMRKLLARVVPQAP